MKDKSYWKQYSGVGAGRWMLFVNSGNEDWALFETVQAQADNLDLVFRADKKHFLSAMDGVARDNRMGLMETLLSCGVSKKETAELVSHYLAYLDDSED